jgi:hypothetical protein
MTEVHVPIGSVPTIRDDLDPLEVHMVRVDGSAFPQVRLVWADPDFVFVPGLTPERARRLAVLLCQAADRADGYPTVVRDVSRDQIDVRGEPLGPPQARSDSLEWMSKGGLP